MSKHTITIFACLALLAHSCQKDKEEDENPYDIYEGTWSGSYSGDDTGDWTVEINEEGQLNGTAVSDSIPDFSFTLNGTVFEDGEFEAEADVFLGFIVFEGQMSGSDAEGTWANEEMELEGTLTGTKE